MKIAMIYPGYGSQFVGMGKELYDEYRIVQEFFEEASNCLDTNFVKLCFASSDAELARLSNAYPGIFLLSASITALLKQEGIVPHVVAGYNTGELSAIYSADGMTLPDGLYMLSKYARLYQDKIDSGLYAAVRVRGIHTKNLEMAITQALAQTDESLDIAIFESSESHVVTGTNSAVENLRKVLGDDQEVSFDGVAVEVGLHSQLMQDVVDQLKMYFEKIDCRTLSVPFCESLNGTILERCDEVRDHIIRSVTSPLIWSRVLAIVSRYDVVLEIGPGSELTHFLKKQYPDVKTISINKKADIEELKTFIQNSQQHTGEQA